MVNSNNFTLYGIHNNLERSLLIFFNSVVSLSSLLGDTTIIIGITQYNAIKLHRVLVVIILHLAVGDLLITIFEIVPQTVSLIFQKWVLGDIICLISPNINGTCLAAISGLTCALSIYKLLTILYPLKSLVWTARQAHVISGLTWVFSILQPLRIVKWIYMTYNNPLFSYDDYTCNYAFDTLEAPEWLERFAHHFYNAELFIVFLVLITTSILLLKKAKSGALERGKSLRWQGVLTVTATTTVFLAAHLPWFIISVLELAGQSYSISFKRTALYIANLNVMSNFYLYCLTVQSFREFLLALVLNLGRRVVSLRGTIVSLRRRMERLHVTTAAVVVPKPNRELEIVPD